MFLPIKYDTILHCLKCFLQILDNVINMLNPDGQTDGVGLDALVCLLLLIELCVGRRVGMDDKRLCIRHICQQREQFEVVNEFPGIFLPALDSKVKMEPPPFGKYFL